jgi:hypothetical protein
MNDKGRVGHEDSIKYGTVARPFGYTGHNDRTRLHALVKENGLTALEHKKTPFTIYLFTDDIRLSLYLTKVSTFQKFWTWSGKVGSLL